MRTRTVSTFSTLAFVLVVGCGDKGTPGDAGPEPDAPPADTGTVSLSWTLSDGAMAVDCSRLGATTVRIGFVPQDEGEELAHGNIVARVDLGHCPPPRFIRTILCRW